MLEQLTKEAEFNLVRDVWIEPGLDTDNLRSPNIHWLTLLGPLGGVSYSYMDNRYPLSVDPNEIPDILKNGFGLSLGYHSYTPIYEGQLEYECGLLPSKTGYCDHSALASIEIYARFLASDKDDAVLWKALREYYITVFIEEKHEMGLYELAHMFKMFGDTNV